MFGSSNRGVISCYSFTPRPPWASLQAYLEDEDARSLNPMQMLSEDGNWATKKSSWAGKWFQNDLIEGYFPLLFVSSRITTGFTWQVIHILRIKYVTSDNLTSSASLGSQSFIDPFPCQSLQSVKFSVHKEEPCTYVQLMRTPSPNPMTLGGIRVMVCDVTLSGCWLRGFRYLQLRLGPRMNIPLQFTEFSWMCVCVMIEDDSCQLP